MMVRLEILPCNLKNMEIIQTIFSGLGLLVSILTIYLLYRVGKRQNEINETALKLTDFAEVFLCPQSLGVNSNILIKNASAYPIYLNSYILNGEETEVKGSPIPTGQTNWYQVEIPVKIQVQREFSLIIKFEDYQGNKYQALGFGIFTPDWWNVRSQKSTPII